MTANTPAFAFPAPLLSGRSVALSNRTLTRVPSRRHRTVTPTMVTATSLVTELCAATLLGCGTYYFIFREQKPAEKAEEQQQKPPSQGIIGLASLDRGPSPAASPSPVAQPPATSPAPLLDTVGVDINDYLDSGDGPHTDKQRRLEEELTFASDSLSDLSGCDATVVVDAAGDVVWVEGDLVGDTSQLGRVPQRVAETGKAETLTVAGNDILPFLTQDVRNVAVLPVGQQGAVLVVASRQADFFGEVEKRIAHAVCGRLGGFLFRPPALES